MSAQPTGITTSVLLQMMVDMAEKSQLPEFVFIVHPDATYDSEMTFQQALEAGLIHKRYVILNRGIRVDDILKVARADIDGSLSAWQANDIGLSSHDELLREVKESIFVVEDLSKGYC